jgi:hypothetical protein
MKFSVHNLVNVEVDSKLSTFIKYLSGLNIQNVKDKFDTSVPIIKVYCLDDEDINESAIYVQKECMATKEDFYIFDKNNQKARVNLKEVSEKCSSIYVDNGFDENLLFGYIIEPLLRYKLFSFCECVLIHSSSIQSGGKSYVFPAWGGTGKTNLLLSFLSDGGNYYSDDLTIVSKEGKMYSYPRLINLFDYNIDTFPELTKQMNTKYYFFTALKNFTLYSYNVSKKLSKKSKVTKVLEILSRYSRLLTNIKVPVQQLFPGSRVGRSTDIDYFINIVRSNQIKPQLKELNAIDLSKRMFACHQYEWNVFKQYCMMYDFLLSENICEYLSNLEKMEEEIMEEVFRKTNIVELSVPPMGINKDNLAEIRELIKKHVEK